MIALALSVPIACWRKGAAREFLETELLPPPATCYGALLSLVGEEERHRHLGCRIGVGLLRKEKRAKSTVLRTLWRIKDKNLSQGNGENAKPDFQELWIGSQLVIWCDSQEEDSSLLGLEERVTQAMRYPETIERFGGWSLGESTHLINEAKLLSSLVPPGPCHAYLLAPRGNLSLPVWVDHVGTANTRYAVGRLEALSVAPPRERLPKISLV